MRVASVAYLALGVLALCGVGYNLGLLLLDDEPGSLVVVGPSQVEVVHPDRSRPLEAEFRLRNPTSQPIRIGDVRTSCSCAVIHLSNRVVGSDEEVSLVVRISSFDTYRDDFTERMTVETSRGPMELQVSGHLPTKRQALVFPQVLYVEPDENGVGPKRTIRLRVPKICARDAEDIEVRAILLGPTESEVVEASPVGQYREYVIHIRTTPALERGSDDGQLHVEAGCSRVEIPVRFAGHMTEED